MLVLKVRIDTTNTTYTASEIVDVLLNRDPHLGSITISGRPFKAEIVGIEITKGEPDHD